MSESNHKREPFNPLQSSHPDSELLKTVHYCNNDTNYTYFIRSGDDGPIKIGQAWNPLLRLRQLQVGNPNRLFLLAVIPDPDYVWEQRIHTYFHQYHLRGEWFKGCNELLAFIDWLNRE